MATISNIDSKKTTRVSETVIYPSFQSSSEEISSSPQFAYHELAEIPVKEVDVLEQLEQNIASLENLQSRFQFVMKEIRYLMKAD